MFKSTPEDQKVLSRCEGTRHEEELRVRTGIIGMKKEVGFKRALTTLPEKYQEELDGDIFVRGCIFEVDKVPNRYGTLKYQVVSTKRINYNVTKDEYLV